MDASSYSVGDRVRLVYMDDPYRDAPVGAVGTVMGVCPRPVNVLDVAWDCGFGLNPCLDVDVVQKVGSVDRDTEFYSVFTLDGAKWVRYEGFTWGRVGDDGLPYAVTRVSNVELPVTYLGGDEWERTAKLSERLALFAEGGLQVQDDVDHDGYIAANSRFFGDHAGIELDVDDVSEDTPDGDYRYCMEV